MSARHIAIKPMTWVSPEFSVASKCDVDILATDHETLVVATERPDNETTGLPVSQGPGVIAQTLYHWYGYEPESMIWLEYNPMTGIHTRVDLVCANHRVTHWHRSPCSLQEVAALKARFSM
ncbi:hypothetical protein [Desulfoplanes formicivorans]|uniref:Uncharacterized protein n=1 Tax=Desulfoplanes formicivorans TaxID=1592317 RepID=A0A194AJH8_9BACT|nr:hypothetical protein [Desulfoplanes formicivorans]GAU09211.1 hypothetical protein DPF_1932 [Desulfoplanes formicivorans]